MPRKVPQLDFSDEDLASLADGLAGNSRGQSIEFLKVNLGLSRREAEALHRRAWRARGRANHARRSPVGKERFIAERESQRSSPVHRAAPVVARERPNFPGGRATPRPDGDYVSFKRPPREHIKLALKAEGFEVQPGGLTYRRPTGSDDRGAVPER